MLKTAAMTLLTLSALIIPTRSWAETFSAEEFNVIGGGESGHPEPVEQLENYLGWIGTRAYRERKSENLAVQTPEQAENYRQKKYEEFMKSIGPFPEKTPLNAVIHGTIDCGDYSIEKLSFESRPGYIVTANLYVPKKHRPPFPIVLCPLGHWGGNEGKEFHYPQKRGIGLARRGYLALVFDPFGQGERRTRYDTRRKFNSVLGYGTNQHAWFNLPLHLTGNNMSNFFIWDGIRALDYLCGRPDADSTRIAVTGASGGGSQTRIITAADPRVDVSAPVCANSHIGTDFRIGRGNPDGEQNVPGMSINGIEYADQMIMSNASHVLLLNATGDRGSVVSSVDMYNDISDIFSRGFPDRTVGYRLIGSDHSYNRDFREELYRLLNLVFGKKDAAIIESGMRLRTVEELNVTRLGNISELGSETPLTLNQKYAEALKRCRAEKARKTPPVKQNVEIELKMRELLGIDSHLNQKPGGTVVDKSINSQVINEKITINSEDGIYLSANYLIPEKESKNSPVVVYVHERGKANGAKNIDEFLERGLRVFALDPRGFSETPAAHPGDEIMQTINDPQSEVFKFRMFYGDREDASFNAYCYQLEKSLFGMRVADILNGLEYLKGRDDTGDREIILCGAGDGALLAVHAAYLDKSVTGLVSESMLISFEHLATAEYYNHSPYLFVHDVLSGYDTDDIISGLSGRKVILANTVNSLRETMGTGDVNDYFLKDMDLEQNSAAGNDLWIGQASWSEIAEMIAEM